MNTQTVRTDFQVVIVGASIAGCTTALKLAQRGIRVAIVEKVAQEDHYKKMCSHLIHPSGTRKLARLGVLDTLLAQGGQATYLEVISEGRGVCYPFNQSAEASNIQRRLLDPALKSLVANRANITTFYGYRAVSLIRTSKNGGSQRVRGVIAQNTLGSQLIFRCALVVAADGRKSRLARLDKLVEHRVPNHRVAMFTYFQTAAPVNSSRVWALDQGSTYYACFANGERVLVSCYVPEKFFASLPFSAETYFTATVKAFVEGQGIVLGEQLDEVYVAKDSDTLFRFPRSKGLTFVGDSFVAADPLIGIGCTWALDSANLLCACIGRAIPRPTEDSQRPIGPWSERKLNLAVSLYHGLHHLKYLVPAYAMAWLSRKGAWVFNPVVFGTLARITGSKSR